MTTWQIEGVNTRNQELAQRLSDPKVVQALGAVCELESVPFWKGDLQRTFTNLFRAVAVRRANQDHYDPTQTGDYRSQARHNGEQIACEEMAERILSLAEATA